MRFSGCLQTLAVGMCGVVFIKSKSSACLLEHGRNVFGEKMYPFRSTTKSYPCVANDISSELPLNLRLKVVGVVEEDQLVKDLKWSPKRSQQVSLSMLPK